ncbi:conserved Plasmodium protein, unknown function [Plasmodium vinckei vinckei]|uniref:Uncharacterized protein n=1 Tax=Plasmodium vinckei vinckei TaxID=54757 RepID=A0A449BZH3_PLAVN|nr:conserved Plasmodium protein, unknown function [Plasmodium vinckei vinckei]KEG04335.1 hypothetical protein YYE_01241 [Plasmodium vinckei vinckei]VEV58865.1 conserved Plasmodium protein, unknown function [Plasmodium vinckei vinckei]
MAEKKNIKKNDKIKMESQNEHSSTSKRKRVDIIENDDILTSADEISKNDSSKKKGTSRKERKKQATINVKTEKGIEKYLNENKMNFKDIIIKKEPESDNEMKNDKRRRNSIVSNCEENGIDNNTSSYKTPAASTYRGIKKESKEYKNVLSNYVNEHSKKIMDDADEKKKDVGNANSNNTTNNSKGGIDERLYKWVNALFNSETKDDEDQNMEEDSKFYGGVKVQKVNTIATPNNNSNSKKINTDVKVVEVLDVVKLPESNNLDESLNSPNISSLAQNGNNENNGTDENNDNEQDAGERESTKITDYIYDGKLEYPLSIYQKIIFKRPDHDYKKWVCNCTVLCVVNLPLNASDGYLLKSLIDMYYKHENRDMTLDVLDLFDVENINGFLEVYGSIDDSPRKYELLASHLGIIKFDVLFTVGSSSHKNEMVISNIYAISKKLYRPEEFPIGSLGLLHFKNEKYAKEFWTIFSNVSTVINGKAIQLMPDINALKIFVEASVYYLQPDSLFAQINYNELNMLLSSIKNKVPDIYKMMRLIKNHFKQESIWNMIFADVDISFLDFYMEDIGQPKTPEEENNDPNESNEEEEDQDQDENQEQEQEQNESQRNNGENSIISFSKIEDNNRVSLHLFKTSNKDICVVHKVNEMTSKYICSVSLLIRVYNTHINKYLMEKGYCLIACPYLDQETGKKVADFLKKFHLLDWLYNTKDQTCYYYAFKSILEALAVFKKNFIASPVHNICSLFLKFPFGIVTAVYLNINPEFIPKDIKTTNPQKLLVMKEDEERLYKHNHNPYNLSVMKYLGIINPQKHHQMNTSNNQNRRNNTFNSSLDNLCDYHINKQKKFRIISTTEEFFIGRDKTLYHIIVNKVFSYHLGLPVSIHKPALQLRKDPHCYKCVTDFPEIITPTMDPRQFDMPLGNEPPGNHTTSNINNSNTNSRNRHPPALQYPNTRPSNLHFRNIQPSNLNSNMLRSGSLNPNNLYHGNMRATHLNQTILYPINMYHPRYMHIGLQQGTLHPSSFHPNNSQLPNIYPYISQLPNIYPYYSQLPNIYPYNFQLPNIYPYISQPSNIHPYNPRPFNIPAHNYRSYSIPPHNSRFQNMHPINQQAIISQLNNGQSNNTHTTTHAHTNITQRELQNNPHNRIAPQVEGSNSPSPNALNRSTEENNNSRNELETKRKRRGTSKSTNINNNTQTSHDSNSKNKRPKKSRRSRNLENLECDDEEKNKKKSRIRTESPQEKNTDTPKSDESSTTASNSQQSSPGESYSSEKNDEN